MPGYGRRQNAVCWLIVVCILTTAGGNVSAQANPDKRLIQKTTLSGETQPLDQLLESLCTKHKLKLHINKESLAKEGIDPSLAVSGLQADGITLGSALSLILEPQMLTYTVDKGTLTVEAKAGADDQLVTVTYPLAGLGTFDSATLTETLQVMCSGTWKEIDAAGGEIVAITPQSVTISQSNATHAEIADLLARVAAALSGKRRPPTIIERSEDLLRRNLAKPVALPAGEVAIGDLDDLLRKELKIDVVLSEAALQDEGIERDTKISLAGAKQAAGMTIAAALAEKKLVPLIRHEVLYITTKAKADEMLAMQIYDSRIAKRPAEEIAAQVTQLKELGPWENVDGIGGAVIAFGPLVLIRQTATAHEQLAKQFGPGK